MHIMERGLKTNPDISNRSQCQLHAHGMFNTNLKVKVKNLKHNKQKRSLLKPEGKPNIFHYKSLMPQTNSFSFILSQYFAESLFKTTFESPKIHVPLFSVIEDFCTPLGSASREANPFSKFLAANSQ